jgi:hypothetical protein
MRRPEERGDAGRESEGGTAGIGVVRDKVQGRNSGNGEDVAETQQGGQALHAIARE